MSLKLLALFTLPLFIFADEEPERQLHYPGPRDASAPPPYYQPYPTLGSLSRRCDVGGVADIIEESHSTELDIDYFKLRVVSANYGCTNGQELLVAMVDFTNPERPETLNFPFYPTNQSRIVFNVTSNIYETFPNNLFYREEDLDIFDKHLDEQLPYYHFLNASRSWWYVDYQEGEPYVYWTNAIQHVRIESNWTNFYALCRTGATNTSNRVKEDAFNDMKNLAFNATDEQIQMMLNDPLFPSVSRDFLDDFIETEELMRNLPPVMWNMATWKAEDEEEEDNGENEGTTP